MTQNYYGQQMPPGAPLNYSSGGPGHRAPRRPGSVTGFAVVSLIVGIFAAGCMGKQWNDFQNLPELNKELFKQLFPSQYSFAVAEFPIVVITNVVLFIAAIGLFSLARWARILAIIATLVNMIMMGADLYVLLSMKLPILVDNDKEDAKNAGRYLRVAFFVAMFVWAVALFSSARVRRAFSGEGDAVPSYAAGGYGPPGVAPGYPPQGYPQQAYPQQGYPQQNPYDPNQQQ